MSRNKENIPFQATRRGDNPVYNLGRTPPSDDFFTDSLLDTSKIPTPSPTRHIDGNGPAYKPRRAIGNTKPLKAAWNAKPAPTSSSVSDWARSRSQQPKPAPIQTTRQSHAPALKQDPTSTPSPPRRSVTDIQSPTSESSPPKGLTDVYQRIADEEDLAAQEGEIGDEDDYTEDSMAIGGVDLNSDRARLDRIRQSRSPSSLPGSRRRSPEVSASEANKENRLNHDRDDDTVLSDPTGMSFLRDLTDRDLAAKLTPHTIDRAKDRARLDRALQKDKPIAFSRAYHRQNAGKLAEAARKDSPVAFSRAYKNPAASLSSDNLQKLDGEVDQEDRTERSSTGSAMTERSEPPPNVPRTWGTKGYAGKEWLQKLHDRSGNSAQKTQAPDSSQVDWTAAAAAVPLPSVESSSTAEKVSPHPPRPVTLHKQASMDRIKEWDLNDFTGQSLQVSNTPPVRVRTNGLDQLRDKEIESLEKRAVTTNRLGEIRKKDSQELLRKLSRSPSTTTAKRDLFGADLSRSKSRDVKLEDDGEPIRDTPIVIYQGTSSKDEDGKDVEADLEHSYFGKEDPLNTLQRLARAVSGSPRPSSSPEDWSLVGKAEGSEILPSMSNGDAAKPTLHMDLSRKSSKQVAEAEATPQAAKAADHAKTPVITGAWTDTILPDTVKTVKRSKDLLRNTQTPHVNAGGWVDTPVADDRRHSSTTAPMLVEEIPEGLTDGLDGKSSKPGSAGMNDSKANVQKLPEMPKSALAGLLGKAKWKLTAQDGVAVRESNDTLNLGDATIESLEDLLTLDNADMTNLIRMGAEFEARERMLRDGSEDNTSAELELLERLGSKLNCLKTNIHDTRKGISKLEHQVSHSEGDVDQQSLENGSSCKVCGSGRPGLTSLPTSTPTRVYLAVPLPRFFHDRRKGDWLPRPTLLGWITLTFSLWYLCESAMCDRYCHPLYAEYYEWPAEPEPRFGYALPTMLWRWSRIREFGPVLFGPLWSLLVAFVRLLGQAFGLTDGFVDDLPSRSNDVPKPTTIDESIPKSKWGPDLSMMNDEFL